MMDLEETDDVVLNRVRNPIDEDHDQDLVETFTA